MPIYRCPITGQNGHLHLGSNGSFFDWAREYFGEFHTYEDNDLVPVPCHRMWVMAGKPQTHAKFIEWCARQKSVTVQAWLEVHLSQNKVPNLKEIVKRVRENYDVEIVSKSFRSAMEKQHRRREKQAVENPTFLGVAATPAQVEKAVAKLANLKAAKDAPAKKVRAAGAKKGAATRAAKKKATKINFNKRSLAAKRAWQTRRKKK